MAPSSFAITGSKTVAGRCVPPATRRLSQEQSERIWVLAATLICAAAVLGSKREAERWLGRPITALSGRRPIELLATSLGKKLVTDHVLRMEYGVYT